MSRAKSFFSELRRRRVVRAIVVYAVTAWIVIQIAGETVEPLQLPGWTETFVVMLAILGFPIVIVLSWAFDLTPEGLRPDDSPKTESGATAVGLADLAEVEPARHSIAVLPFADMSPERDQSYFCAGVAEDILNLLAGIRGLQVASRLSSFQFGGDAGDVASIGNQLHVRHVLQGSVRRADNTLRINAQLVDVDNGDHVWSEGYDREVADIFALQHDITRSVCDALELKLTPMRPADVARPPDDVEAYEFYLRGRHYFNRHGAGDFDLAAQMFARAVEIDPGYALAWAGLADANAFLYLYANSEQHFVDAATSASEKAALLAPELAESHASRGLALLLCKCYPEAEREFEQAIRIDPTQFDAYYFNARASVHQGKMKQAEKYFLQASEVQPEDYQSLLLLARIHKGEGELDRAMDAARRGIGIADRHLHRNPDDVRAMYLLAGALHDCGERQRARELIERTLELAGDDGVVYYNVACYYAQAGEPDKALDSLSRAGKPAMASRAWLQHDEDLAPLRGHPRYQELLDSLA